VPTKLYSIRSTVGTFQTCAKGIATDSSLSPVRIILTTRLEHSDHSHFTYFQLVVTDPNSRLDLINIMYITTQTAIQYIPLRRLNIKIVLIYVCVYRVQSHVFSLSYFNRQCPCHRHIDRSIESNSPLQSLGNRGPTSANWESRTQSEGPGQSYCSC
jgi:hypothetical protein